MTAPPRILVIAGSDSSGGAGIQADLKTIAMLGGYGMTALTAITAQNTVGVQQVSLLGSDMVIAQLESCLSDIGADAIKIGMLGSPEIARAVSSRLEIFAGAIIFDPVMVASSGAELADKATIEAFASLLDIATLATPNLPELAALTAMPIGDVEEIGAAAHTLAQRHDVTILAKGGHGSGARVTDILVTPDGQAVLFEDVRLPSEHTHGTGCTLSSAIATLMTHNQSLPHAIRLARRFVRAAMEKAPGFGAGNGPLGQHAVRSLG